LLLFRLDINNLAKYKSSAFIYKFSFGKPGRTQQLFPHFGKPYRWAILYTTLKMIVKELQLLSEALWESVKSDLNFFAPIQVFVKKLAELDFSDQSSVSDAIGYAEKIEKFFDDYRSKGDAFYFPPNQTATNDRTVKSIFDLAQKLKKLSPEEIEKEIESVKPKQQHKSSGGGQIFIGHGRNKVWARVQLYLRDELDLKTLTFEDESRTSETIVNIIEDFLNKSSFAILILTAEDETADGKSRARQNVIHEAGLFQGRLGFDKVIILKQEGVEDFSNIDGLQYISFSDNNIEQCFYELQRKLKKIGLLK
jgi:predicted nucleotide-binding protein